MAKKKATKAASTVTPEHKKAILDQIKAAEKSLKALDASVKTMREEAVAASYVGGKPMAARKRRRKR